MRAAIVKSCCEMKPPSRMFTSEALMVAMPERPATGIPTGRSGAR
jgi:hypothetical protein